VKRLVYTSTPSVVHGGGDLEGVTESVPFPKHYQAFYPETKAIAERKVLKANGSELATVALRPHLIWGPGDPHLIPRILARAKAGKLRRIGKRVVKVDVTYVDNAADAHIQAACKLTPDSAVAGKAYFISNGEPVVLWDFLNRVITDAGIPPVTRTVPVWVAKLVARAMERFYKLFGLRGEPPMTRFVVEQLSTSHWYDISAAKRDFGYEPAVSIEEGLRRLKESL
jgi:2-alkyl-3-oxoalkanoate reductase